MYFQNKNNKICYFTSILQIRRYIFSFKSEATVKSTSFLILFDFIRVFSNSLTLFVSARWEGHHSMRLSMMAPVACCPGRYLGTMQVLRVISVSKELEALITLESNNAT